MIKVVFPGTFDPPTLGHLDIIKRASRLFDKVIILVADNPNKKTLLSTQKRLELINDIISEFSNVSVDYYSGLVVEYAKQKGCTALIRSIRNSKDYNYELELFRANRIVSNEVETIFLNAAPGKEGISSSLVRELIGYGVDVSALVPDIVIKALKG